MRDMCVYLLSCMCALIMVVLLQCVSCDVVIGGVVVGGFACMMGYTMLVLVYVLVGGDVDVACSWCVCGCGIYAGVCCVVGVGFIGISYGYVSVAAGCVTGVVGGVVAVIAIGCVADGCIVVV